MKKMSGLTTVLLIALLCPAMILGGCAHRQPLPQPRKVVDPVAVPGSVSTLDWDIAAVGYEYFEEGIDYRKAKVAPVYLVFRNKSQTLQPTVSVDEVRGLSPQGEFLPYSLDETTRLVFSAETTKNTAADIARSGGLGALAGASLGALLGLVGGGDNIWKGAVIGAAIGGGLGGVSGASGSEQELKSQIRSELVRYGWTGNPIPPTYTQVGYVYLPGGVGITSVKITVRSAGALQVYTLPVTDMVPNSQTAPKG